MLSGDAVVIRGQPRGGPPPERTLALSNITAPKMARRANPNVEGSTDSKDEVERECVCPVVNSVREEEDSLCSDCVVSSQ